MVSVQQMKLLSHSLKVYESTCSKQLCRLTALLYSCNDGLTYFCVVSFVF